ncbi:MAG: amino acid permease [Hyphomicrobiales bacterium]|nr:amino acid permease [Hyphomicrobiales bacterium]
MTSSTVVAASPATDATADQPRPKLSIVDGVSMLVGIVIGIGIFKTPSLVAMNVADETGFLGLWLAGGIITLIGAMVYAELASAHPSTGGEYHFLSLGLGKPVGLMFAWARISVIQTGAIAAVAFVFGDYAQQLMSLGAYGQAIYAAAGIALFTAINVAGATPSTRVQNIFTTLTVVAILALVVSGLMADVAPVTAPVAGASSITPAAGLALVFILLTYGGWNETAYLSAELRDPKRSMGRVLVIGTLVIVVIYLLVNYSMLRVLGLEGLRQSNAPGAELMRASMGAPGAIIFSAFVCLAALSTLNATIFTGARVYHAVGNDIPMVRRLGVWNGPHETPTNALLMQAGIALALVFFGAVTRDGFQAMVDYTAPVFWCFLLLVGVSYFKLRVHASEGAFRAPLYPLTPLLFCATCAYLLYSSLAYTGLGSLIGVAVLAAGIPLVVVALRSATPATQS